MTDITRLRFAVAAGLFGAISLALSALTVTARAKLWLGPQTLVLGGVGAVIGGAIALTAWRCARSRGAELFDRPLLSRRAMIALILACAVVSAGILRIAFATFANSADEYGFLYQAATFLHGRLWNTPPADPGLFAQNYLVASNGIWVSQYLPGWPAILAWFELAHMPAWLAAPVCGAVLLWLLWFVLHKECCSPALASVLLLAYATTDFFLLNGATYFSHTASALIVLASIVCILQAECSEAWWWPAGAGACFGLALLCRIDSAVLVGIAALAGWIEQGHRSRALSLGIAGTLPPLLVFAAYNWLITGDPLLVPTAWAGNIHLSAHGLTGVETSEHWRMLVQTAWRIGELADTASLVLPALYLAALVIRIRQRRWRCYDVVPIANFVVFLIFPDLGGFQMGPRYWFDGFVVMHLTVGNAFSEQPATWQRFVVACCLLLVPVSLARLPAQVAFQARVMHERAAVFRVARALPADRRSVVLVNDFDSAWNDRANRTAPNVAKDFIRNGTQLDRPVLYARGDMPDALGRACALYPDAAIYTFHLDGAHPNGWLAPLACPP